MALRHVVCITRAGDDLSLGISPIDVVGLLPPGAVVSDGFLMTAPTLADDQAVAVVCDDAPDAPEPARVLVDGVPRLVAVRADSLAALWGYDLDRLLSAVLTLSALAGERGSSAVDAATPFGALRAAEDAYRLADATLTLTTEVGAAYFRHWRESHGIDRTGWREICAFFDAECPCRRVGHGRTEHRWIGRPGRLCWPFDASAWQVQCNDIR